ncbi:CATRA conflict system CASPASE/TPR repeat-associated protein [Micromonospora gifhornensis]|uniref:CATRA conflict system CASPASE/TPR repeat-associated protein n=1 Tax=Micromonospora gifhornensis TaxID=84594 RepID=UPI003D7108BD
MESSEGVPRLVDQQLVVHVFAPATGPHATAAYSAIRDLWAASRHLFRLDREISGLGVPPHLPETAAELPTATQTGPEWILAGQERADADYQAVLRRHHDLINLSLALAPGPPPTGPAPAYWPGWHELDRQWSALAVGRTSALLGVVRVYLAGMAGWPDDAALPPAARAAVGPVLAGHLPDPPSRWAEPAPLSDRALLWELPPADDARWERRLVLAAPTRDDATVSAWVWSDGSAAIPPLARYLLHAAKVRHQLRVLRRDNPADRLRDQLDTMAADVRAGSSSPAVREGLAAVRRDANLSVAELRAMRHAVAVAKQNMAASWGGNPPVVQGLFADDRDLVDWFLTHLDDEREELATTAARAGHLIGADAVGPDKRVPGDDATSHDPPSGTGVSVPPSGSGLRAPSSGTAVPVPDDVSRCVFVVHGRDGAVRDGIFTLLRALDLKPLEWETLVSGTGMATPFLGDVVAHAVTRARAAVVLLTPDDVVGLHPSLRLETDERHEWTAGMQARPNVMLELGMALAAYPDRTIIVKVGSLRPVADLDGRNFLQLRDTADFRRKLAHRLRLAGCDVDDRGQDWLSAGDFADLDAYRRRPEPIPPG